MLVASGLAATPWRGPPDLQVITPVGRAPDSIIDLGFDRRGGLWRSGTTVTRSDSVSSVTLNEPGVMGLRGFVEDAEGRLWAGSVDQLGYLEAQEDGTWAFVNLTDQVPESFGELGVVWRVVPSRFGQVFVTENGIVRHRKGRWQAWRNEAPRRPQVFAVGERLFANWRSGHLLELTEQGPVERILAGEIGRDRIFGGRATAEGGIFFYGGRNRFTWQGETWQTEPSATLHEIIEAMWTCDLPLPDGRIAIGTFHQGLAIYDPATDSAVWVNRDHGLPNNAITGLRLDPAGALWVATMTGIARLPGSMDTMRLPLVGGASSSISYQSFGIITNSRAGMHRLLRLPTEVKIESLFNGQAVISYSTIPNGELLGILVSGVFTVSPDGTTTQVRRASGRTGNLYRFLDPNEHWRVDLGGQLYSYTNENGRWVERPISPPPAEIATTGVYYLVSFGGQHWFVDSNLEYCTWDPITDEVSRPLQGRIKAPSRIMSRGETGAIHYSESGIQIVDLTKGTITSWNALDPWLVHRISRQQSDRSLWMLAERRMEKPGPVPIWYALRAAHDGAEPEVFHLPISELSSSTPMFSVEPEGGALWIGDSESVRRVPREQLRAPPVPTVAPELWAQRDGTEEDRLERIHFTPAPLGRLDLASLEVRLMPLEQRWRVVTEPSRELAGLRPGKFTFEARYRSADGQPGPVAQMAFVIPPPWYLHPVSVTGFAVLLVGSGALAVRRRLAMLEARRLELERLIAEATEDLVKASAAKTEFIARMSHELRNPMNGVVGLSEVLLQRLRHPEERSLVQTLRACAGLLDQMIGDVLDVARIDSGQVTLEHRPFTLHSLVEDAAAIVAWDANRLDKEVSFDAGPADAPVLDGDPSKLQQILVNFLSNACKYSNGPRVTLRAVVTTPVPQRRRVRFEVSDEGPGMTPEDRERIFDRFFRTESARTGGRRGTGLGLAICRELAEHMGGTVGVLSNAAGGSTFFLEVTCPIAAGTAATVDGVGVSFAGRRALVVDDMDHNRLVAGALLGHLGFTVDHAEDGTQALEALATGRYDCALLDWDLPDIDGVEVARRFRQTHPSSPTRLIACTAFATPDRIETCLAAGMQSHVSKPVTENKLRRALGAALASAPPTPATARLDLSALRLLSGADPDRLAHQIDRFVSTLEEEVLALEAADSERQRPAVRRHLHRLLSHAGIVSAADLLAAVEAAQAAGEPVPEDLPNPGLAAVRAAADALAEELSTVAKDCRVSGQA